MLRDENVPWILRFALTVGGAAAEVMDFVRGVAHGTVCRVLDHRYGFIGRCQRCGHWGPR